MNIFFGFISVCIVRSIVKNLFIIIANKYDSNINLAIAKAKNEIDNRINAFVIEKINKIFFNLSVLIFFDSIHLFIENFINYTIFKFVITSLMLFDTLKESLQYLNTISEINKIGYNNFIDLKLSREYYQTVKDEYAQKYWYEKIFMPTQEETVNKILSHTRDYVDKKIKYSIYVIIFNLSILFFYKSSDLFQLIQYITN